MAELEEGEIEEGELAGELGPGKRAAEGCGGLDGMRNVPGCYATAPMEHRGQPRPTTAAPPFLLQCQALPPLLKHLHHHRDLSSSARRPRSSCWRRATTAGTPPPAAAAACSSPSLSSMPNLPGGHTSS